MALTVAKMSGFDFEGRGRACVVAGNTEDEGVLEDEMSEESSDVKARELGRAVEEDFFCRFGGRWP